MEKGNFLKKIIIIIEPKISGKFWMNHKGFSNEGLFWLVALFFFLFLSKSPYSFQLMEKGNFLKK